MTPLVVIAPHTVSRWLQEIQCCDTDTAVLCHFSESNFPRAVVDPQNIVQSIQHYAFEQLYIDTFHSVKVDHCEDAYGVVVRFKSGFSFAYSGDTRPCSNFQSQCRDVDLLVHETSFVLKDQQRAIQKAHSTLESVVLLAEQAGVKRLICTHFSQRYQFFPPLPNNAYAMNCASLAFDGMTVVVKDLALLPSWWQTVMTNISRHTRDCSWKSWVFGEAPLEDGEDEEEVVEDGEGQ